MVLDAMLHHVIRGNSLSKQDALLAESGTVIVGSAARQTRQQARAVKMHSGHGLVERHIVVIVVGHTNVAS